MKIKVVATIILDTEKMGSINKGVKTAIEQGAFNKGSSRLSRMWAWEEATRQDTPDISLELL